MSITQAFLPVMIMPESRVIGGIPIGETTFNGDETTYSLAGHPYRMERKDVVSITGSGGVATAHSFMMLPFTATEERQGRAFAVPGLLSTESLMEFVKWVMPKNVSQEQGRNTSDLFKLLLGAKSVGISGSTTSVQPPVLGASPMEVTVKCDLGSASACSFMDIDFLDWMASYPDQNLTVSGLTLLLPNPLSVTTFLKQFLVSVPKPLTIDPTKPDQPELQFNTLRFIKIAPGVIPPGTYSYEFQLSTVQGVTIPGTLYLVL